MESEKLKNPSNPREKAKFLSILFWCWIIDLFEKGYTKVLTFQDLYEPMKKDRSSYLGNKLENQWNLELNRAMKMDVQPNLLKTIFLTFYKEILYLGLMQIFVDLIFRLGLPLVLGLFLQYFKPQTTSMFEEAFLYLVALIITNFLTILTETHLHFNATYSAGRIRIATSSLIYKKALKLDSTYLGTTSTGKIINLLANDVNRFEITMLLLHSTWTSPLSTFIIAYILFKKVRFAGLVGIAVMLSIVPIQVYTQKLSPKYRSTSSKKTDERIRLLDEILSGIQVIKMYSWEKLFKALVQTSRLRELNIIKKIAYIRGFYLTIFLFIGRLALYVTMMSMWMLDEQVTVDKIFVLGTFYNILSTTISVRFTRSFAELSECKVSITRIQSFLFMEEFQERNINKLDDKKMIIKDTEVDHLNESIHSVKKKDGMEEASCIKLNNVTVKWYPSLTNNTLENVSVELEKGKLYAVIGKVGSGKSSFLSAILGEIKFVEGSIDMTGTISYAPQNPWVFASSIRQNILFGENFHREKYRKVIDVCSLTKDLEHFPDADHTLMDEKGSSLSGGQRARISLARAVYRDVDIYLLDDPLSAVDVNVGKFLFEKCILQYLKDKTRILVTHHLQNLKYVDGILLFSQGNMQYFKDYQSLVKVHSEYNNLEFADNDYKFNSDFCLEKTEARKRLTPPDNKIQNVKQTKAENDKKLTNLNVILEKSSKDVVKGSVLLNYFRLGSSLCGSIMVVVLFIATQCLICLNDFYVSSIITAEEYQNYHNNQNNDSNLFNNEKVINPKDKVYSRETYAYHYIVIVLSILLIGLLRCCIYFNACLRSSKNLHNSAFGAILHAPMIFFEKNPSGCILNRFSKETAVVDELLPNTLLDAGQVLLTIFGAFAITCIVNPLFLMPGLVIGILTYWMKKIYLRTSKNLKRLEGMTRSPILTHLNVTLNGISTIRAFKMETKLNEEFDRFQDNHTSSWYLYMAGSFAYSFALDMCSLSFIICIAFNFLFFKEHFNSSEVGLAITQMLWISAVIQWGMRQSAEVSNSMTSVERILEYKQISPEKNVSEGIEVPEKEKAENEENLLAVVNKKPKNWPSEGNITFKSVFMTYENKNESALKNLNFQIKAMEKIGIVGRTGGGKSSLICAMFRLADLRGIIEIDGIDTTMVPLEDLRSRISIIPQHPVLFSGTLRRNLDPFNEFSDKQLWDTLEEVQLKNIIITSEKGLNYQILEKGANFSVGQRQLICLARAILRNNRILAVDEATANVDPQTDSFIQKTIRKKFKCCTILTIAHRLNTIIDSDKIMVMDNGYLVEFEHPYRLLEKEDSHFNSLVKKTGDAMYKELFKLAEQCYNEKYNCQ